MAAINVRNLCKTYGTRIAVDDLSVTIEDGEVFALLGPNGAGKTTTVEVLTGHRRRDHGVVEVLGRDPAHADLGWRTRIGVVRRRSKLGVSDRTAAVTSAQATGQL